MNKITGEEGFYEQVSDFSVIHSRNYNVAEQPFIDC